MRRYLLLLPFMLALATLASAQTKVSGTLDCDKADPIHTLQIPDQRGLSYVISQYKCTWSKPLVIEGLQSKGNVDVEFYEIAGNSLQYITTAVTYYVNGDRAFSKGTGTSDLRSLKSSGQWTYTGGTGKLKGIQGGGTATCKSKSSESGAGYICDIASEHTLPATGMAGNQNPGTVTWKMNPAKSKTNHPLGLFKSSSIKFETLKDGGTKAELNAVRSDGFVLRRSWTGKCDGKDFPVTAPDSDMTSCITVDASTTDYIFKKSGKEVWRGRSVIAEDGKTGIDSGSGTDDKGKPFTYSMFMEKQ